MQFIEFVEAIARVAEKAFTDKKDFETPEDRKEYSKRLRKS